jgi:putative redox protein
MNVTLERKNNAYLFEAKGKSGVPIMIDNTSQEGAQGASPMELLLMGVGSCSAIDVINILEKQKQIIETYHIEVTGGRKQTKEAKPFDRIHVHIRMEGALDPVKVKKAAALSFDKYCSVSITLEKSVSITYAITLNNSLLVL